MPPLRGPEIDHWIELEKDKNSKEKELPWGPLYNMSRGELLVLRKELISLLNKGWIREKGYAFAWTTELLTQLLRKTDTRCH
ncbi:hypothetical protein PTT_18057 [Pyrenophora teres f. teres 0-1]|uniref:Uncharacterized protein n=1 Tax=Pyrenophora teres f. teres (strain 0-1) TaxID=861557 RepID=E3S5U9_PYRTT|nr:hypothetical protein PTT_18057 [Pyrenophora teres f. teres 0-1]